MISSLKSRSLIAALALIGSASVASAQTAAPSAVPLNTTPLAGVSVGNGVRQSQPVVDTFGGSTGAPLVGVGTLSGRPAHAGSLVTLSVLNTNSLLGVGAGGTGKGLNVPNPTGKPVFSGLTK